MVAGGPWCGKSSSSAVRARSIAAVDPFVPTTIVSTGRRWRRWAEMAAAGQTAVAWDLLVAAPLRSGVIDAMPAPAAQRPRARVRESWAHETRPGKSFSFSFGEVAAWGAV